MTVSTTISRVDYLAGGGAGDVTFPYTFRIFNDEDLKVYVATVLQTLNVDYSVTGAGDGTGGNVVFAMAPTALAAVAIVRELDITQETDYVELDKFPAETHEAALDKLTMIAQETNAHIDTLEAAMDVYWSGVAPDGPWILSSDYPTIQAANTYAYFMNKLLVVDKAWTLGANTTLTASVMRIPVGSFTKASTYTLTFSGSFENPSNGHCFIGFDPGDVTLPLGTIVSPLWFGMARDGVTDDYVAVQSAIQAAGSDGFVSVPPAASYIIIGTSLNLTPGGVPINNLTIEAAGIGATKFWFNGTGYLFKAFDDLTGGAFNNLTLGRMSMYLGTSGTGLIQLGRLTNAFNVHYFLTNRLYDLYLIGDATSGTWRAGTVGISSKQLGSSVVDNVMIHNVETAWIQDSHTENTYNKIEMTVFNKGLDIRGQTAGTDKSTFIQPAIHGPHGSAVDGFGIKVNVGDVTMINPLFEPNGTYSGSGNNLIWLAEYAAGFSCINGGLAIDDTAVTAFDNVLKIDSILGTGYHFENLSGSSSIAGPPITIAALSASPGAIGYFTNCSPQIRTLIRNTAANIGRYVWLGPGGTSNTKYFIDTPNFQMPLDTFNITDTDIHIGPAITIGSLYFVSGYISPGGSQCWFLLGVRYSAVDVIASNNATGATFTWSMDSGILHGKVDAGTIVCTASMIIN